MINVTCKSCQKTMKVPDKFAGRKGKCKHCKSPIRVPKVVEDLDDFLEVEMEEVDDFMSRSSAELPQRSRSRSAKKKKSDDSYSVPQYLQPREYKQQSRFESGFIIKCVLGAFTFCICGFVVFAVIREINARYKPTETMPGIDQQNAEVQKQLRISDEPAGKRPEGGAILANPNPLPFGNFKRPAAQKEPEDE